MLRRDTIQHKDKDKIKECEKRIEAQMDKLGKTYLFQKNYQLAKTNDTILSLMLSDSLNFLPVKGLTLKIPTKRADQINAAIYEWALSNRSLPGVADCIKIIEDQNALRSVLKARYQQQLKHDYEEQLKATVRDSKSIHCFETEMRVQGSRVNPDVIVIEEKHPTSVQAVPAESNELAVYKAQLLSLQKTSTSLSAKLQIKKIKNQFKSSQATIAECSIMVKQISAVDDQIQRLKKAIKLLKEDSQIKKIDQDILNLVKEKSFLPKQKESKELSKLQQDRFFCQSKIIQLNEEIRKTKCPMEKTTTQKTAKK